MSVLPYRVPAPPEPEGPGEAEAAYARDLARFKTRERIRFAVATVVGLAALAALSMRATSHRPPVHHLRRDRAATAKVSIAATRRRAEDAHRHFVSTLRAVVGSERHDRSCPTPLPAESSLAKSRKTLPLVVAKEEDVAAGAVVTSHFVLVAHHIIEPRTHGTSSYQPGSVEGRVYVYDVATDKVVCSADVHATSSNEIGYAYASAHDAPSWMGRNASLEASLQDDFRFEIERAVLHSFDMRSRL